MKLVDSLPENCIDIDSPTTPDDKDAWVAFLHDDLNVVVYIFRSEPYDAFMKEKVPANAEEINEILAGERNEGTAEVWDEGRDYPVFKFQVHYTDTETDDEMWETDNYSQSFSKYQKSDARDIVQEFLTELNEHDDVPVLHEFFTSLLKEYPAHDA